MKFIEVYPDFIHFQDRLNYFATETVQATDELFFKFLLKKFGKNRFLSKDVDTIDSNLYTLWTNLKNKWVKILDASKSDLEEITMVKRIGESYIGNQAELNTADITKFFDRGSSNKFTPSVMSAIATVVNMPEVFAEIILLFSPIFFRMKTPLDDTESTHDTPITPIAIKTETELITKSLETEGTGETQSELNIMFNKKTSELDLEGIIKSRYIKLTEGSLEIMPGQSEDPADWTLEKTLVKIREIITLLNQKTIKFNNLGRINQTPLDDKDPVAKEDLAVGAGDARSPHKMIYNKTNTADILWSREDKSLVLNSTLDIYFKCGNSRNNFIENPRLNSTLQTHGNNPLDIVSAGWVLDQINAINKMWSDVMNESIPYVETISKVIEGDDNLRQITYTGGTIGGGFLISTKEYSELGNGQDAAFAGVKSFFDNENPLQAILHLKTTDAQGNPRTIGVTVTTLGTDIVDGFRSPLSTGVINDNTLAWIGKVREMIENSGGDESPWGTEQSEEKPVLLNEIHTGQDGMIFRNTIFAPMIDGVIHFTSQLDDPDTPYDPNLRRADFSFDKDQIRFEIGNRQTGVSTFTIKQTGISISGLERDPYENYDNPVITGDTYLWKDEVARMIAQIPQVKPSVFLTCSSLSVVRRVTGASNSNEIFIYKDNANQNLASTVSGRRINYWKYPVAGRYNIRGSAKIRYANLTLETEYWYEVNIYTKQEGSRSILGTRSLKFLSSRSKRQLIILNRASDFYFNFDFMIEVPQSFIQNSITRESNISAIGIVLRASNGYPSPLTNTNVHAGVEIRKVD